jgi:sirohydrochlorin cobaltochelatase
MTTALVLAGHGSHISSRTAGIIWEHVDALRTMGVADEVTAAFWKEMPYFHTVFRTLTADDITVVPLFTAQGYFTQTVIPTEMGLTGAITQLDGRTIRYTRTLSEHPYLGQIVQQRIQDAYQILQTPPYQTAIAIIGHSTKRNPESRAATEAQAAQIRALGLAAEVQAVYLDDTPEIAEIYQLTSAPNLIAVPYFLALGSHTTFDVPEALGLQPEQNLAQIQGRRVIYTPPVGIDTSLREVVLELARDAGAPLYPAKTGSMWDCFPKMGQSALLDEVKARGLLVFGQLLILPQRIAAQGDATIQPVSSPGDLRTLLRENPFRSLVTATDLPEGWYVQIKDPAQLHAVVETVYPGAVADWAAAKQNTFEASNLTTVVQRQTGNYRKLENLTPFQQETLVGRVCTGCVKHPTWHDGAAGDIPCPEPCNYWLSIALEEME